MLTFFLTEGLPGVDVQLESGHVGPAPGDTGAPAHAEQGIFG